MVSQVTDQMTDQDEIHKWMDRVIENHIKDKLYPQA